MFYGRENDIDMLSALWLKPVASLVTCRGRRRIGKSTLIEEFARRSDARMLKVEGMAPDASMNNLRQLKSFRSQLQRQCKKSIPQLKDWPTAFAVLDECLDSSRTVLLLDEISWMGKYDCSFPGELKIAWDNLFKKHERLIVVLCGSVSTWIARNILNNTGFVGRASLNLTIRELPLRDCMRFWGKKIHRLALREVLDVLSVTGGVPRYLEEVNPSLSAEENIRRMCFMPQALLRDDFTKIFNTVFGDNATAKRSILKALSREAMILSELADVLQVERSGTLSDYLEELETAGFISGDKCINPRTGKLAKQRRYRVCDNYTRFYLRYIEPNAAAIDTGAFNFTAMESLKGWETVLGLQFENLVLASLPRLLKLLSLEHTLLKSAAPFFQKPTSRRRGCQIDLLLQSDHKFHVVEIKRKHEIGREIIGEVEAKIKALQVPRGISVRTVLVYEGILSPSVEADGFFDFIIPVAELLNA